MRTFLQYLKEDNDLYKNFFGMDFEVFIRWFQSMGITNRTPKNINKTDHKILVDIQKLLLQLNTKKKSTLPAHLQSRFGLDDYDTVIFQIKGAVANLRITKQEIENTFLNKKTQDKVVRGRFATYIKMDSIAYDKFTNNIADLESFLSTLTGFHKKILPNLTIRFVDSSSQKSRAKYVTAEDVIQINSKRMGKTTEEYGSLRYVVLHELGHRYLKKYPQNWNYDAERWMTTKYSFTDSMSGEEKFAELFALSHWPNKYNEYKNQISLFLKAIK